MLGHLIRRLRTQHGFSLSQGSVLGRLDREGPQCTSHLATVREVRGRREGWLAEAIAESFSAGERRALEQALPLLGRLAEL